MLRPATPDPIEHGPGVFTFAGQSARGYTTTMRIHRGTKYQLPVKYGRSWECWIEGEGQVTLSAKDQRIAEQACIRRIEHLIATSKHHAQRAQYAS